MNINMLNSRYVKGAIVVIALLLAFYTVKSLNVPMPWDNLPVPGLLPSHGGVFSDYPINLQIENLLAEGTVKVTHQVTFDKDKNSYRYYYRIQNMGDKTILFNWEVLDRENPNFLELAVKEAHEVSFNDNSPPVIKQSQALILKQEGKIWTLIDKGVCVGPAPTS